MNRRLDLVDGAIRVYRLTIAIEVSVCMSCSPLSPFRSLISTKMHQVQYSLEKIVFEPEL